MGPNEPLDVPPPRYRRYWSAYDRPYSGCGCLWSIIVIVFIWWILSWIFGWGWGWGFGSGPVR